MDTGYDVIDDSLYSRQRYVLGDSAMQRMAKSNVLLVNIGGLGVEIAKNIVLAGIKSLTIQDGSQATYLDLGCQFFITEDDVKSGKNRAETSAVRISELNPYVSVRTLTNQLTELLDLEYLKEYQCVILTETSLDVQLRISDFCRKQNPQIMMIVADVYGVFSWTFCDFGDTFDVVDPNGEEPKQVFISNVTKDNPGEVTTLDNMLHGFETGDLVRFKEIRGMDSLNGTQCKIKDLSKFDAPANIHLGMLTTECFKQKHGHLPGVWCLQDADNFVQLAAEENIKLTNKLEELDTTLLRQMSLTCCGRLAPLCATLGGIVAQEALKALTGKFTPLHQWLHLDAAEVLNGLEVKPSDSFQPVQSRYDALRICVGGELCQKLATLKLFMVGCGAIGCEMMKNYALLGISTADQGKLTITDHDLIEKSNLNRQFLFKPHHIRKAKSTTSAASAKEINPALIIDAHQNKVWPQTEADIYHDKFYESQDVVVNALDNLEARRYVDSRCVTNQRPLLESGTMGAKGHVQVIIPHLTESYSSQRDPPEIEVPYCTLKSFPAQIEHCIQWARDKFESTFVQKPQLHNKFWSTNNADDVIKRLSDGQSIDGCVTASKVLYARPLNWIDCVTVARLKFEKYFNHRAKNLLHIFPLDTKMPDGSLFWQSPKRPPTPVNFDPQNPTHMLFITSWAKIIASVCGVPWAKADVTEDTMKAILLKVQVPEFRPSGKRVETDENAGKTEETEITGDDLKDSANRIQTTLLSKPQAFQPLSTAEFEKDDDSNGHIDFITAASNLRATMYNIETVDRLKAKRIAGRIVPAIATTTAAVAGLVTIELIKLVKKAPLEHFKNCFLNLALPIFLFSEPGPVEKVTMLSGTTYTLWDRWEIRGNKNFTVQEFLNSLKEKYNAIADSVIHGVKMLYVPIIPAHKKRLRQPMLQFLKSASSKKYVDLVVSFKAAADDTEVEQEGPPVRYFFGI
ncbi:hypothetical protein LSH36_107g04046 [Paralvinella palmiformis]|uniref:E1 ubiquitin-activating enzyme n=1 Tax=Paralvinella palmiformis TaxID=53620 RepID=A0AAD9JYS3_9ANNE|nr:hypothetical protein LSH36_107g04046 [Paralvinella palmiformis]